MNAISFTAKLVSTPTIRQKDRESQYNPCDASVVEFDIHNPDDLYTFRDTARNWSDNGAEYSTGMALALYSDISNVISPQIKQHYYALTTQKENFEKLDKNNILGLMIFSETNMPANTLDLIQVNPVILKANSSEKTFKDVGKQLVQFAQSKFGDKDISLQSDPDAIEFYKSMNFEKEPKKKFNYLRWRATV